MSILFLKIVIKESIIGSPIECKSRALMLSIPEAFDGCASFLNCFERLERSISMTEEHFGVALLTSTLFSFGT